MTSAADPKDDFEDVRRFADCWNHEQFFDAHETLEPRWIATRDRGLRGLIQLAAAFHHLKKGNKKGARVTLERAILRLTDPENAPCPIDQTGLAKFASSVLAQLDQALPEALIASRPRLSVQQPRE
jgi:predicted metal-dependent hydrolase